MHKFQTVLCPEWCDEILHHPALPCPGCESPSAQQTHALYTKHGSLSVIR